jgi:hypothetical protein
VTVTACHELFEMAIDPIANLWAQAADGTEFAYEMSDTVEEDTFLVDGIEMSNFVHPAWFEPFKHPPHTKFDHLGKLTKPFSMNQGRLRDREEGRQGHAEVRFTGQRKALRQGRPARPSQRIPQAQWASNLSAGERSRAVPRPNTANYGAPYFGWPMPCECVHASANSLIKVSMVASILAVICSCGS